MSLLFLSDDYCYYNLYVFFSFFSSFFKQLRHSPPFLVTHFQLLIASKSRFQNDEKILKLVSGNEV